ncbi:MAG: type II toxin-antitoxin system Phd/YefM family antitoxin [Leptospira sp.]|nr:type II toxin-antitoxin system Phd/YefM family antitoxin [Leptospira sp.]
MTSRVKTRKQFAEPEIVYRNGKPSAIILDLKEYQKLLERAEDAYDLKILEEMRKKPLKFKKLDDFLKENQLV